MDVDAQVSSHQPTGAPTTSVCAVCATRFHCKPVRSIPVNITQYDVTRVTRCTIQKNQERREEEQEVAKTLERQPQSQEEEEEQEEADSALVVVVSRRRDIAKKHMERHHRSK